MRRLVIGSVLGWLFLAGIAAAQDATLLQKLRSARALYEIGLSSQDPLLILAAAKLRKSVPIQAGPEGDGDDSGKPIGWRDMLEAAAPMMEGNDILMGMAEDIIAERDKGVSDGPVYSIAQIGGKDRDVYRNLPFDGGKYADIYVEGPSGSELNLIVRDAQGRLVCSDTDISAIAYCGWNPEQSGTYDVSIENRAARGGKYSLVSN